MMELVNSECHHLFGLLLVKDSLLNAISRAKCSKVISFFSRVNKKRCKFTLLLLTSLILVIKFESPTKDVLMSLPNGVHPGYSEHLLVHILGVLFQKSVWRS